MIAGQTDPRLALYEIDGASGQPGFLEYVNGDDDANWVAMVSFE